MRVLSPGFVAALLTMAALELACAQAPEPPVVAERPKEWAVPLQVEGVPNLYRVDTNLYRSAQPSALGMRNLEKLGVRTVIDLRTFHSDRDELAGTALLNDSLDMKAWHIEDEDVVGALRLLCDEEKGPFLVHCQQGADRTGVVCAMYRVVVQGWTKDAAIKEMVDGGYGFHPFWKSIVRYVRDADVDRVRREVQATSPAGPTRAAP